MESRSGITDEKRKRLRDGHRALAFLTVCLAACVAVPRAADTPEALAPVPSPAQLAWQRLELHAFVHFGPNTFSGAEWGSGRRTRHVQPDRVRRAGVGQRVQAAGFTGVILTAKHHDGFCLWPSK